MRSVELAGFSSRLEAIALAEGAFATDAESLGVALTDVELLEEVSPIACVVVDGSSREQAFVAPTINHERTTTEGLRSRRECIGWGPLALRDTTAMRMDDLPAAIDSWCYWVAHGGSLRDTLPSTLTWLRTLWGQGDDHLPLSIVHDLGHLLCEGRGFPFASSRNLAAWTEAERATRLMYEDKVIGRWALDPSVQEASVIVAGLPKEARDAAVAHAISLCLAKPLRGSDLLEPWNFAELRSVSDALSSDAPETFADLSSRVHVESATWGQQQLLACVSLLPTGRLFRPEDLWEIAHLQALPNDSARLALREINAVAAGVGAISAGVLSQILRKAKEVPVDAEEPDQYPAGGFDAISTRGTFENLVRSEVAYVGEGQTESGGVDLFDVRFAENELLFYTRDESPLLDARHDVTLVIDRPAELRHKQPALPSQTLVLAEGVMLSLLADMAKAFGTAGVRATLVWKIDSVQDREAAAEEAALVALPLASEMAHRRLLLLKTARWDDVPAVGRIVFSPRAEPPDSLALAWVRVGEDVWKLDDQSFDLRAERALRGVVDALLLCVARGRPAKKRKSKARPLSSRL